MLQDENQQIRLFATNLAVSYLDEDLRSALEFCASIKGGRARRNARELVERLNWEKWAEDPELLAQKKREARANQEAKARQKRLGQLRKETQAIRRALESDGWKSFKVTSVAGSAYVDWRNLYSTMKPGDKLDLEAEPGNPYDALAVKVLDGEGNKLGYIPSYENKELSEMLNAGESVMTILLKVEQQTRIHQLHIEVFIKGEIK